MSKPSKNLDHKKVSSDIFTLTYGSLVSQLLKDYDTVEDVNGQLERMGYNMGLRLVEDFLAKTSAPRCLDFKDVAERIQHAFKMYLGITPSITNWSQINDEFSILIDYKIFTEFVELPDHLIDLKYCNILPGIIRGALEMVMIEVRAWFVQDHLRGDSTTELRVKFIKKLEDALPSVED